MPPGVSHVTGRIYVTFYRNTVTKKDRRAVNDASYGAQTVSIIAAQT